MAYDIVIGRSKKDQEKYGTKGTIFLGKHYVKMGNTTSLSNKVFLDMISSHVVFVVGKRGGGKCLTGDSLITLTNGEVVPIQELEYRKDALLSLSPDLKMEFRPCDAFYKRQAETLYKIKLRTGKELSLTPEHPLLTVKGWMPVKDLPFGARIATPRIQPSFGDNSLPEYKVKFLAYLLAEGHLGNNQILFSNKDGTILADYIAAVKAIDPRFEVVEHSKPGCYRLINRTGTPLLRSLNRLPNGTFGKGTRIDSRSDIRKWLDSLSCYGKKARERDMPQAIFTLPRHQLSLFLNRLFSCDGSVYKESASFWKLSYASSSEQFIRSVQHLLLRFGVVAVLRKKHSKKFKSFSYELEIKGEFVHTYLQEIGFFGEKTLKAQQAIKDSFSIRRNPNTDTIPKELWESYKPENWAEIGRKMGYAHPKAMRESTRYSPSRQKLLQIAIADEQEGLQDLATSDIFWDEITAIEKIEGEFTVYDLTVPETHNFIANDIIVHNSYSLGVMAEGMADLEPEIRNNLSIILLDTMGIYWTMKYPNLPDKELLYDWGLKPHSLDIKIFTPQGFYNQQKEQGIPTDAPFSIKPAELSGSDWTTTFSIDTNDPLGVLIDRTIHRLQGVGKNYSMKDIVDAIMADNDADKDTKNAAKNHFEAADGWGVFSQLGTPLSELAAPGQITVLDVSCYATAEHGWAVKSLVVGLTAEKLFNQRMLARKDEEFREVEKQTSYYTEKVVEQDYPMVWLVIDEAHEFLPKEGKTLASDPLITILREGRQPGISLVLASQQPGKIHTDVMTQSDTILAHRITAKIDTDALGTLMQSYMRSGLDLELDNLPRTKGAALILDDNNERMFPLQIRPRFTWHGGSSPTALKEKKDLFG